MTLSVTALDLITQAFLRLGVYGVSEPIDSGDQTAGLTALNGMLDQWSNEALTVFAFLNQSAPLIVNQQSYTIGPGGNFNMTRPLAIGSRPGSAYVQDSNGNNYEVSVVQQDDWNLIPNRLIVTSNYPDTLFYDPQYPLGIMNFYPVPNAAYTAFWTSQLPLADLSSTTTPLILPPGYAKAIWDNLVVELWDIYKTGDVTPSLARQALASKANIKRINTKQKLVHFDSELANKSRTGTWNWAAGIYPGG